MWNGNSIAEYRVMLDDLLDSSVTSSEKQAQAKHVNEFIVQKFKACYVCGPNQYFITMDGEVYSCGYVRYAGAGDEHLFSSTWIAALQSVNIK